MKNGSLILLTFLFLFFPLWLFAETPREEGKIIFLKGDCFVKRQEGEYERAAVDRKIFSTDTVKSLKDSALEITTIDGDIIVVKEDSEISFHQWRIREKTHTAVGVLFGNVKLLVRKLTPERQEFLINTLTVTAGIRGTEFDVSVREDGAVLINVEEGEIETEYEGSQHTLSKGETTVFYLSGERQSFKRRIDSGIWRREALERLRKDPNLFLKRMLERERLIIERLRKNSQRIDEFRKEWVVFLKRVRSLESRGMYKEEQELIFMQIQRTKKAIQFFVLARRNLTIVRSIIALTFRIEKQLAPEAVKDLPLLDELKREYVRLSRIITRIDQAEKKLREVLSVLNKKYDELGSRQ